ncbi:MAG: MOSC domain-containing protein [Gemmatimonadaceae bacterium]
MGRRRAGSPCITTGRADFSDFLQAEVMLVYQPDDAIRPMRAEYAGAIREARHVSLSDGAPLLLIGQASLDGLNERLADPVPMNRFRPNVVVTGAAPFAEDTWQRIRIGDVTCEVAKPCARCATTTVDQATGVRGVEPLRTLATFRKREGGVMFGQNLAHHAPGALHVGDVVTVLAP